MQKNNLSKRMQLVSLDAGVGKQNEMMAVYTTVYVNVCVYFCLYLNIYVKYNFHFPCLTYFDLILLFQRQGADNLVFFFLLLFIFMFIQYKQILCIVTK